MISEASQRHLIVNADDFGHSPGVNHGIITTHELGIVTSASLMVRGPAAAQAAAYGRERPSLSLGLHVDLGEWRYREGAWAPRYIVCRLDDAGLVAAEVSRQLSTFRSLVGRDPSHIDSHQHVHLREPVRSVLLEVARPLAVPLRHWTPGIHYCGKFHGQSAEGSSLPDAISAEGLISILESLPPGLTELGCHPGAGDDFDTPYRIEREHETKTLCDPRVQAALRVLGIALCSFADPPVSALGRGCSRADT
ncbi:MAG TPA: ChbG/HpnK family deacetylase [Candidatus Methylomirabilis sp.]|nr:ChbG/HpnK family deacetylase [Candidatus Methylomirabilis sp.]